MDLIERLNILKDSGTLSQKNYCEVLKVIEYFEEYKGKTLTEENAAPFITHLCMALERTDKGENAEPLDRGVYSTAAEEPIFPEAVECCKNICSILPQLSDNEAEYVTMHICMILGPEN